MNTSISYALPEKGQNETYVHSESQLQKAQNKLRSLKALTVGVRVRPFKGLDDTNYIICKGRTKLCVVAAYENSSLKQNEDDVTSFSFNHVYNKTSSQLKIYKDMGSRIVDCCLNGINSCIFAYGQTGSGKTYSMFGITRTTVHSLFDRYRPLFRVLSLDIITYIHSFLGHDISDEGIIPRICSDLFKGVEVLYGGRAEMYMSMTEVYKEKTRDMLEEDSEFMKGCIYENKNGSVLVKNVSKRPIKNYSQIRQYLKIGRNNRVTKETNMNATSSRSHAVVTLYCKFYPYPNKKTCFKSKINLVDLAGSEQVARNNSLKYNTELKKEGISINLSLLHLGRSLRTLSSDPNAIVGYRSSSLTWLLKDSLGGNAKTFMLATVAPELESKTHTLNTLEYATCARKVKTNMEKLLEKSMKWNEVLKKKLLELKKAFLAHKRQIKDLRKKKAKLHKESIEAKAEKYPVVTAKNKWRVAKFDRIYETMFQEAESDMYKNLQVASLKIHQLQGKYNSFICKKILKHGSDPVNKQLMQQLAEISYKTPKQQMEIEFLFSRYLDCSMQPILDKKWKKERFSYREIFLKDERALLVSALKEFHVYKNPTLNTIRSADYGTFILEDTNQDDISELSITSIGAVKVKRQRLFKKKRY